MLLQFAVEAGAWMRHTMERWQEHNTQTEPLRRRGQMEVRYG